MKIEVAHINLTGDYFIPKEDGTKVVGCVDTDPNLHELSAFLGALRGGINANGDLFLSSIADVVRKAKASPTSRVVLSITSSLNGDRLQHVFDVAIHKAAEHRSV